MPTPSLIERVAGILVSMPPEMVADMSSQIVADYNISNEELGWLIAHWENTKPRVHRRTLSDGIFLRDGAG